MAADRLQQSGEEGFLFFRDGARKQSLVTQAQELGLNNLTLLDSVPKEDVPRYWSLLAVLVFARCFDHSPAQNRAFLPQ